MSVVSTPQNRRRHHGGEFRDASVDRPVGGETAGGPQTVPADARGFGMAERMIGQNVNLHETPQSGGDGGNPAQMIRPVVDSADKRTT